MEVWPWMSLLIAGMLGLKRYKFTLKLDSEFWI
jgi:hypothetical protein